MLTSARFLCFVSLAWAGQVEKETAPPVKDKIVRRVHAADTVKVDIDAVGAVINEQETAPSIAPAKDKKAPKAKDKIVRRVHSVDGETTETARSSTTETTITDVDLVGAPHPVVRKTESVEVSVDAEGLWENAPPKAPAAAKDKIVRRVHAADTVAVAIDSVGAVKNHEETAPAIAPAKDKKAPKAKDKVVRRVHPDTTAADVASKDSARVPKPMLQKVVTENVVLGPDEDQFVGLASEVVLSDLGDTVVHDEKGSVVDAVGAVEKDKEKVPHKAVLIELNSSPATGKKIPRAKDKIVRRVHPADGATTVADVAPPKDTARVPKPMLQKVVTENVVLGPDEDQFVGLASEVVLSDV